MGSGDPRSQLFVKKMGARPRARVGDTVSDIPMVNPAGVIDCLLVFIGPIPV